MRSEPLSLSHAADIAPLQAADAVCPAAVSDDNHANSMMRLSAAAATKAEQHDHRRPCPIAWVRCCCASSSPRLVLEGGCFHWHCKASGCAGDLDGSRRPTSWPRPLKCCDRGPQSGRRRQTPNGPPCGPWPREAALKAVLWACGWRPHRARFHREERLASLYPKGLASRPATHFRVRALKDAQPVADARSRL